MRVPTLVQDGARRHLTSSQRAAIAAEMLPFIEEEARGRQTASLKQGASVPEKLPERDDTRTNGEARAIAAQITEIPPSGEPLA